MVILETLAVQVASNISLFFILGVIGTALWGDGALIFFTAFSVNYKISLWLIFFAAYIGTMIGDSLWFLIGIKLARKIEKNKKMYKGYKKIAFIIDKIFKHNHLLALTVVKYLYGTRVITIFYLAKEKIGYKKFIYYDFISTLFWVLGVGLIGYLVGLGFVWIQTAFKNIQLTILALIIIFILFGWLQRAINMKIGKLSEK